MYPASKLLQRTSRLRLLMVLAGACLALLTSVTVIAVVPTVPTAAAQTAPVGDTIIRQDPTFDAATSPSLALTADDRPVVAYRGATAPGLKVLLCDDQACDPTISINNANIDLISGGGAISGVESVVALNGMLPIVLYEDFATGELKTLACDDFDCTTSTSTAHTSDHVSQRSLDVAVSSSGLPVVAYSGGPVTLLRCADSQCTSSTAVVVQSGSFMEASIELDSNDVPVVAYWDLTTSEVIVAHCGDVSCSAPTITTVDTAFPGHTGVFTMDFELDGSDLPVLAYGSGQDLRVARCVNATCTVANVETPIPGGSQAPLVQDIEIDPATGVPVVIFTLDVGYTLTVLRCDDPGCTSALSHVHSVVKPALVNSVGGASLELDSVGNPVVAYQDIPSQNLHILRCDDPYCDAPAAPTVTNVQMQVAVDTCAADVLVPITIDVADDDGDLARVDVGLTSPSGNFNIAEFANLTPGPVVDSVTIDILFPMGSEPGFWPISYLEVHDATGVSTSHSWGASIEVVGCVGNSPDIFDVSLPLGCPVSATVFDVGGACFTLVPVVVTCVVPYVAFAGSCEFQPAVPELGPCPPFPGQQVIEEQTSIGGEIYHTRCTVVRGACPVGTTSGPNGTNCRQPVDLIAVVAPCAAAVVLPVQVQAGDLDGDLASLRIEAVSLFGSQAVQGLASFAPGPQVDTMVVDFVFPVGSVIGPWLIDLAEVQDATGLVTTYPNASASFIPGDSMIEVLPCGGNSPVDTDGDGVLDDVDNCIFVWNPLQVDVDLDGVGDSCDTPPGLTINPGPIWEGIPISYVGCPGGTVQMKIGTFTFVLTEIAPPGTYQYLLQPGDVPEGTYSAMLTVSCPDGSTVNETFTTTLDYLDPSGLILDQLNRPIAGATVTLLYSDVALADPNDSGFTVVPDGSTIMSPANRMNPMLSRSDGFYRWDTIEGWFVVAVTAPECINPDGSGPEVRSAVLPVPPEQFNIDLVLECELAMCNGLVADIVAEPGIAVVGTAADEVILGTSGDDVIDAGGGNDVVCAGEGNDVVLAGDGDDIVFGGPGNDILRGNPGDDDLDGEAGNDRVLGGIGGDRLVGGIGDDYLGGFGGADDISGGPGADTIFGGFGADTINGDGGPDTIYGLIGNDVINGGGGADVLNGDAGMDTIDGGDGDDVINGGNGPDTLFGNRGDDIVSGGKADDALSGGLGSDTCIGNKHHVADTADASCETKFGVP